VFGLKKKSWLCVKICGVTDKISENLCYVKGCVLSENLCFLKKESVKMSVCTCVCVRIMCKCVRAYACIWMRYVCARAHVYVCICIFVNCMLCVCDGYL